MNNPASAVPILVVGAHRTGTTWVGKMLAAGGQMAYISEPTNVLHRPGILRVPTPYWYTYICQENEHLYYPALRETLKYRYHLLAEIGSLRSGKDLLRMLRDLGIFLRGRLFRQQPLLKDPFAVFSAPWFAERLGCQVVITVRHPAAFASSLKRLNWPFDFTDLLAQPLLMQDWLEPFRSEMEDMQKGPAGIIDQASLLWKIVYQTVSQYRQVHPDFLLAYHEHLSLNPLAGFEELYQKLGLEFNSRAQAAILSASSPDNPKEGSKKSKYTVRLDSQANLHNWKRRLERDEIRRIRSLTEAVTDVYYPGLDWD